MTKAEIMTIFLQDVGEPFADGDRLTFLEAALSGAIAAIEEHGIVLTSEESEGGFSAIDANLIRMYSAWLVRGRASAEAMPNQLRRALHNRLFAQKMKTEASNET